jgi:hypothetical protein
MMVIQEGEGARMYIKVKRITQCLALSFFLLPSLIMAGNEPKGYVAFFFVSTVETDADFEAHDDFQYFYNKMTPWLKQNGFVYTYHSTTPIIVKFDKGKSLTILKDQLKNDLGIILSKMDGTYKISYGVGTDVDIIMEIKGFFGSN